MSKVEGLEECKSKMKEIIKKHILDILVQTSLSLINDALDSKGYSGFTGNTQTSYTCGIYISGKLVYMVSAGDKLKSPVHAKVKKGKFLYLSQPYEGGARSVYGDVDTNGQSGQKTAENFLKSCKDVPSDGYGIIMTTGTEYSVFLEKVKNLTVLGTTYLRAKTILHSNIKPIQ